MEQASSVHLRNCPVKKVPWKLAICGASIEVPADRAGTKVEQMSCKSLETVRHKTNEHKEVDSVLKWVE